MSGAILAFAVSGLAAPAPENANRGVEVVVVFNAAVPESKAVAEHYAAARKVPPDQVIGFKMPEKETISRREYGDSIAGPLRKEIERRGWIEFKPEAVPATTNFPARVLQRPVAGKIRYVVLCWGVPLRISHDASFNEPLPENARAELRRTEAAVDSELAFLPRDPKSYWLAGPVGNPFMAQTNSALFHPTNGLLMVARLDGPTPEIARGLVDKAMEAERTGLWGRAYFDARGTADPNYLVGDTWVTGAADIFRRVGYETVPDTNAATFPASFPLSHVAMYMGWYDTKVGGPFTLPTVEFMPGAFAYHLFSFSAQTLRGRDDWVPLLLAKGATCTIGYVDEPYLQGTINLAAFTALWVRGFTFGEAAYGAMNALSWQTTVAGDPLYRPFGADALALHDRFTREKNPLLEWSMLRAINQNMIMGEPADKFIRLLEGDPFARTSAVLQEKLAGFYLASGKLLDASDALVTAHRLAKSIPQRNRLAMEAQRPLSLLGREATAVELLETLLKENPLYADKFDIYTRLAALLRKQAREADAARYQGEADRLAPPAPPAATNAPKPVVEPKR